MQTQEEANTYLANAGYTFVDSIGDPKDAPDHSYSIVSTTGIEGVPEGMTCQIVMKVSNTKQGNQILVQYARGGCFDTVEHAASCYETMKSQISEGESQVILRLDNDNKFIYSYLIDKTTDGGSTEDKRTSQLYKFAVENPELYNALTVGSHTITVAGVDSNNVPGPQSNPVSFEVTEVPLTFNVTGAESSEVILKDANEQQNPSTCRSFGGYFTITNKDAGKAIKSITVLDNGKEILSGDRNSYTGNGYMYISTTSADFQFYQIVSNITINCEIESEVWYTITTQSNIPDQIDRVIVEGVTDQGVSSLNPLFIKVKLKNPTQYTITEDCIAPNETLQEIGFDKESGYATLRFSAPTEAMYIHINAVPATTYTLTAKEIPDGYSLLTSNISNALYNEVKVQGPVGSIAQTNCSISSWGVSASQYNLETGIYTFWFNHGFDENGVLDFSVYNISTIEKEKIIPQLVVNSTYDGVSASLTRGYCLPGYSMSDENGVSLSSDTISITKPEGDTNSYILFANLTGDGKIYNVTNDSLIFDLWSTGSVTITVDIKII